MKRWAVDVSKKLGMNTHPTGQWVSYDDYSRDVVGLKDKLDAIGSLLMINGCDCDCGHHSEEHDDDCTLCLACRIGVIHDRPTS